MAFKKHLANFATLLNLGCGFIAIILIAKGEVELACYFVILGAVFDFLDGFVARGLKISSELGKQLDSLSDLVTFGVVPGLIAFDLFSTALEGTEIAASIPYITYLPVLIPMLSAYRLGKFNIDDRQTLNFIGLPTPANALFWISLPLLTHQIMQSTNLDAFNKMVLILHNPLPLAALIAMTSSLLVMELPLFSMKFSKEAGALKIRIAFFVISIALFIILRFVAVPFILILYIIFSIINNTLNRTQ